MRKYLLLVFFIFNAGYSVFSQNTLSGKVLDAETKSPVEFAVVAIPDHDLWAVTDHNGAFAIQKVPSGKAVIAISCLGYVKTTFEVDVRPGSGAEGIYYIRENNLSISEVVVTAQKRSDEIATSYTMDRNTLDHMQMLGVADVMALLPGGQTSSATTLTSEQRIFLRSESDGELDNPSFGTAIEVDGVRLSNNGSFSTSTDIIEGIDTRHIGVSNIESIEIITGLPSVEHGDLSTGLVRINTRKGKSPYVAEVVTKPKIKSYAFNKGFDLGNDAGVINTGFERTHSISQRASPYTTYTRNNLSLTYRNTFSRGKRPLELTWGISGNIGGYDSESDPDAFTGTYRKVRDHTFRTNVDLNWLLNRPWITGVEFSGAVNYADRRDENQTNQSSASSTAAIHATEEGYFIGMNYDEDPDAPIVLIPPGYWYRLWYHDNKPVTYTAKVKANWTRKFGRINSRLKAGAEFVRSGNYGKGVYYDDMRYAPTWREFRYDEQPFVNNMALYAEEEIALPVRHRELQVQAGVRADMTYVKGSEYGTVHSFSPRINARYTLVENRRGFLKRLSLHAGWGDAVKLPSSDILYPSPSYSDKLSFAPGTMADGTVFYAYYTIPARALYNPDLKWQRTRKAEIGVDLRLGNTKVSVSAFRDKTFRPYKPTNTYLPFSYKLTDQRALEDCEIPSVNRIYTIDQTTGIVTVTDKTGQYASQELAYITRNTFKSNDYYTNGSPLTRKGIEWIVDFGKIPSLKTTVRVDGNYYYYKGVDETLEEDLASSANMADGNPYKYIAYYVGSSSYYNGSLTKKLTTNLTVSTHIPAIRMIVSFRLESCFYDYSRYLSEYSGGSRSFPIDSRDSYVPSSTVTDIYAGNQYVAMYPLYYISLDDMGTKIPFAEKFLWAKENDQALYNELAKMVNKTPYNYSFNANKYSDYFSANISLTKEIGDQVSISFQANNFFNNMGTVTSSWTGNESSLYGSSRIPPFYYGLSMRVKL
jgi:outer membrane cobalamin receptor